MGKELTEQQILALTADPGVIRDAQKLANAAKWLSLGRDERVAWGEHQGSAAQPYRVQVELSAPAFKCSCPSRKSPCKHALGLFLLLANRPDAFQRSAPPEWVSDWLAGREKRAGKKSANGVDAEAQSKRAVAREAKVAAGMQELELWLRDLARGGLAADQVRTYEFWDRIAARMIDAQASEVARLLRRLSGLPHQGDRWAERLLDYLGRLFLLVESYKRLETLPLASQADVRTMIGWTQKQEELLLQPGERDEWLVMYSYVETEDRLKTRRTGLLGLRSRRTALLLDFAYGAQAFEGSYAVHSQIDAELVFYPSAYHLRAAIKQRNWTGAETSDHSGFAHCTIGEALEVFTRALSLNPWLDRLPLALRDVTPYHDNGSWSLRDDQRSLPVAAAFAHGGNPWWLPALSGGHPLTVFGEWDGYDFLPLSALAQGDEAIR